MQKFQKEKSRAFEERTGNLGLAVIELITSIRSRGGIVMYEPLLRQILRSSTSVGANYMEANGASSRKDFRNKIYLCKKEAQETKHWLKMIAGAYPGHRDRLRKLWDECQQLVCIFQKIISTLERNEKQRLSKM